VRPPLVRDGAALLKSNSVNQVIAATLEQQELLWTGETMLPRRRYGRDGVELSVIGFGGIVVKDMDDAAAREIVAEAVSRGVNYFDVAPSYGDAEERLGPALQPFRDRVFLACKTLERTCHAAAAELERSLRRLRTDHMDLYQFHAVNEVREVDLIFAPGGALKAVVEARRSGRIRYIGFSSHDEDTAIEMMGRYDFDSVLFPFNFAAWFNAGFGRRLLAMATKKGVSCLALKALARQRWPPDDPQRDQFRKCWYQPVTSRDEAELALRFTLGLPVVSAVSPGEAALLRLAMDVVGDARPLTHEEEAALMEMARDLVPVFPAPS